VLAFEAAEAEFISAGIIEQEIREPGSQRRRGFVKNAVESFQQSLARRLRWIQTLGRQSLGCEQEKGYGKDLNDSQYNRTPEESEQFRSIK